MKGWGAETGQAMMLPSDKDAREFRPVVAGGSVGSTSCGVLTWDRLMPHVSAELGWTGFWSRPMYDMNLAGWLNALQKTMQITMADDDVDSLTTKLKQNWTLWASKLTPRYSTVQKMPCWVPFSSAEDGTTHLRKSIIKHSLGINPKTSCDWRHKGFVHNDETTISVIESAKKWLSVKVYIL